MAQHGQESVKTEPAGLLSASTRGTSFLVLIQIVSRALTFLGNQVLLRYLSPESLGVATQLELYSISVLYFSRESLRVAIQRQPAEKSDARRHQSQAIVNVSYLTIAGGVLLAYGFGISYASYGGNDVLQTPTFRTSVHIVGIAAVVELLAEPAFAIVQQRMLYKSRALTETSAAIAKCLGACAVASVAHRTGREVAVIPFAIGQMAYACVLVLGYFSCVWPVSRDQGFSLLLAPLSTNNAENILDRFPRPLLSLTSSLYLQSTIKQILTQGDSLILALLSNLSDQGVFALASNYGGLIARMLFQPIEESSRNAFAKLVASDTSNRPNHAGVKDAAVYLSSVLRFYGILSVVVASLGPTALPLLIRLLMGSKWSSLEVTGLLSTYCYYIPFLAVNGITEAFVSSVATESELRGQAIWMGAFSVGFAGAAYTFLRTLQMGARGLVWANISNMTMRTAWSFWFIEAYLRRNGSLLSFSDVSPSPGSVVVGAVAAAALPRYSHEVVQVMGIAVAAGLSMYVDRF